jgi:hypothetical protein
MNILKQDYEMYQNDPSSRKSPQGDILDYLIWDRLSTFWASSYAEEDRQALNAIYEAAGRVLDAETLRLEEINRSKGIFSCPVLTQRRWMKLELNRYKEIQAFLRYALTGSINADNSGYTDCSNSQSGGNNEQYATCTGVGEGHAAHWHLSFSWIIPEGDVASRRTLSLPYPVLPALVEIWRTGIEKGRRVGTKLVYGVDFTVMADGKSVRLSNGGLPGEIYDVVVGLDFSDREIYEGRQPVVALSTGPFPGMRTVTVPPEFEGFPVILNNVYSPPPLVGTAYQQTNKVDFTSTSVCVVDTQHPIAGVATFPSSYPSLLSTDGTFVFGLAKTGTGFSKLHAHDSFTFYCAASPSGIPSGGVWYEGNNITSISLPNGSVPAGINGSLGFLGQELVIMLNGKKLHYSEYNYDINNVLILKTPLTFVADETARIDIRYTREYDALPTQTLDLHNHISCVKSIVESSDTSYEEFDDGGNLDYDPEETTAPPWGLFDSIRSSNTLYIPDLDIDESTLRVYKDGVLLTKGVDYLVSIEPETSEHPPRVRIGFLTYVIGSLIELTYRKAGSIVSYGLTDAVSCSRSYLNSTNVEQIIGNTGAILDGFITAYGKPYNADMLIEALRILAAGGNPFMALFADEFYDYSKYGLNAENTAIDAETARAIESLNTFLISIPVLVDHPHRPTKRLVEGEDYVVRDGAIGSSFDLTLSRGAEDDAPGVWWCPVVVLDENRLSSTFGWLVGDVRNESDDPYKNALIANHMARFAGPTNKAIESAANVFLGSPIFMKDGKITKTEYVTTEILVTVQGASIERVYELGTDRVIPPLGSRVFAGQSISSPLAYESSLANMKQWNGASLIFYDNFEVLMNGDVVWVEMFDENERATWVKLTVEKVAVRAAMEDASRNETVVTFRETVSSTLSPSILSTIKATRPSGAPYAEFDGVVDSIVYQQQWRITTSANESFTLPLDAPLEYTIGQTVIRGEAVIKSFARVYDDAEVPDWLWLKPDETANEEDSRYATIEPYVTGSGLSRLSVSKLDPPLPRGTSVSIVLDNTGITEKYTITGGSGTTLYVTPAVTVTRSGLATFTQVTKGTRAGYFELPVKNGVTSRLSSSIALKASVLPLSNSTKFPEAGRVGLQVGAGVIEVEYYRKSGNFLMDVVWEDLQGHNWIQGSIPAVPVVLLAEYDNKVLNPAMEALVDKRVVSGATTLDETTAPVYYRMFKGNSAVLELNKPGTPAALKLLLEDLIPPSTSLITLSRHVIEDVYEAEVRD